MITTCTLTSSVQPITIQHINKRTQKSSKSKKKTKNNKKKKNKKDKYSSLCRPTCYVRSPLFTLTLIINTHTKHRHHQSNTTYMQLPLGIHIQRDSHTKQTRTDKHTYTYRLPKPTSHHTTHEISTQTHKLQYILPSGFPHWIEPVEVITIN